MRTDVMAQLGTLAGRRAVGSEKQAFIPQLLGRAAGAGVNMLGRGAGALGRGAVGAAGAARAAPGAMRQGLGNMRDAYRAQRGIAPPAPPAPPTNPWSGTAGAMGGGGVAPRPPVPAGPAPGPRPGGGAALLGLGGLGAAGTGAAYAAADTDHIGGLSGNVEGLERMRGDYQKQIADLEAGGGGWWRGGSQADRQKQIDAMKANLQSGNFGGGLFDSRTFAQRRQQAQAQADAVANGGQGQGGLANQLFGYRDQAAVDAAASRFDGDEMAKRFSALGITSPRGRRPATPAARPGGTIGTGATNWDNYRTLFHNSYGDRDWSHLLRSHPANAAQAAGG